MLDQVYRRKKGWYYDGIHRIAIVWSYVERVVRICCSSLLHLNELLYLTIVIDY